MQIKYFCHIGISKESLKDSWPTFSNLKDYKTVSEVQLKTVKSMQL